MPIVLKNLPTADLIKISIAEEDSQLTTSGALSYTTLPHTGRSPDAKKIVYDDLTKNDICWENNNKISEEEFSILYKKFINYKSTKKKIFLQEVSAVRDPDYSLDINIWTE